MNILFLIGNGFDLNLGLKTSYSDFYKYYHAITISPKNEYIDRLKENISKDLKNWSDLELALGEYTEKIESENEFHEVFEDIGDELANYIEQQENAFDFTSINQKKLFEHLASPQQFLLQADLEKLLPFMEHWGRQPWNTNIITFNYTNTLEKIIGDKLKGLQIGIHNRAYQIILQSVEHIHGYLNDRMVMGVNDVSQIKNKSFHNNQGILEAFVKEECNKIQKHNIDKVCKNQITSANLICIFGSSIGETDKMWWNLIGEQLKKDCQLIIFHRCTPISQRRAYKKGDKEREVLKSFLNKTNLTEVEKNKIKNNIYISINSHFFNLKIKP